MEYLCADTIFTVIINGFVKVSWAQRKVTLVGFYYDLSKKYIPIGDDETSIDF